MRSCTETAAECSGAVGRLWISSLGGLLAVMITAFGTTAVPTRQPVEAA